MRIEEDLKLGFKDVLIRPKRSTLKSRSDVELERQFTFKHSGQSWSGVPIIAANMDTVGTFSMASALASFDILTAVHKHYSVEEWQAFINNSSADVLKHVMVSTGTSDADFEKTKQILDLNPALNFVCIDVANGYSEHFVQFVAKAREAWPTKTICAGNVVTGEMCEELILSGADIVKVGIGPGSVCTTRVKTGVGYPQLSAVIECADAAHGLGGMIVSDGGCTTPGDVAKAFGGGADFVMLGGMLAGHEESGGRIVEENGEKFMLFYGMSSESAMKRHVGGVADHNGRNYRYAGGGDVSANFPFRRCDEWDGITLACCSTPALEDYRLLKMRFSCSCTRINVVRLVSSFRREAPTYVQAERRPPKISRAVFSTGPRSGSLTVLPSAARYSATPPT